MGNECCPGCWAGGWLLGTSSTTTGPIKRGAGRRKRSVAKHDKEAMSRSFRSNMLLEGQGDVYDFYNHIETIGEGSISTITKVRKKRVGGSARYGSPKNGSIRLFFNAATSAANNNTGTPGFFGRMLGGGKRQQQQQQPIAKLVMEDDSGDDNDDERLGGSVRFGDPAAAAAAAAASPQARKDGSESRASSNGDDDYDDADIHNRVSRHNEMIFALKSIDLRVVNDDYLRELRNEIEVLKTLDHPNVVRAYETFQKKKNIGIIMENLTGGDLHTRHPYTEREAAMIVGKILSAVVYMHKQRIIHRDIKYENIIFESSRPDAEPKLIDFGLAKAYLDPEYQMTERVGTVYTMAPEVLMGSYSFKADMWSLGVVTYMLLSGHKPFWGHKKKRIVEKIMRAHVKFNDPAWKFISKEAKEFVSLLLQKDPEKRPTAEEAQAHAWLHNEYKLSNRRPNEDVMDQVNESLVRYADSGEFKKVALNVIAHKSTAEQIMEIRSAFDQYDSNDDGSISYKGFKAALSKFNYTEEELDRMFRSVDVNENGIIFFTEFLAATLETQGKIEEHRLAEAFDRLDADDTGYISKNNLRNILGRKCTEEYLEKLMAEVDANNDGHISYEEFLSVFMHQKRAEIQKIYDADERVSTSMVDEEDFHSAFGEEHEPSTTSTATIGSSSKVDRIHVGAK